MHLGLQRKSTSTEFISDMGLMCNALQELSELSLKLQDRKINLYQANVKVRALVQIFKERMAIPGNYYDCAAIAANKLSFQGVELYIKIIKNDLPINLNTIYKQVKMSIEEWLLSNNESNSINWTHILYPKIWHVNVPFTFGEKEIRSLAKWLRLNERKSIRGFREY
jgi:hypothetical protein